MLTKSRLFPNNFYKSPISLSYSSLATAQASETRKLQSYDEIPGPKTNPFIGNLLEFKKFGKYLF